MDEYLVRKLAFIYAHVAEMEGMKAENKKRELNGEALAYDEQAFQYIQGQLLELANPNM